MRTDQDDKGRLTQATLNTLDQARETPERSKSMVESPALSRAKGSKDAPHRLSWSELRALFKARDRAESDGKDSVDRDLVPVRVHWEDETFKTFDMRPRAKAGEVLREALGRTRTATNTWSEYRLFASNKDGKAAALGLMSARIFFPSSISSFSSN